MKLVKLITDDKIELVGIIHETDSKKIVIHVHGLAGNFYENSFIDYQRKSYLENNYSYFVFNNRGNGYFTDLIKRGKEIEYIKGGAAFESFVDSYLDIDCAINYAKKLGYNEIVLQGHSYGCNKVINYYINNNDKLIKSIILLAPCDIFSEFKIFTDEFDEYIAECRKKVIEGKGEEVIFNNNFPPMAFCARTVVEDFLTDGNADTFRYRDDKYIDLNMKKIEIPILIQIGELDQFALTVDKDKVINYFKNNLTNYEIDFIENADHGYNNYELTIALKCTEFLKKYE